MRNENLIGDPMLLSLMRVVTFFRSVKVDLSDVY